MKVLAVLACAACGVLSVSAASAQEKRVASLEPGLAAPVATDVIPDAPIPAPPPAPAAEPYAAMAMMRSPSVGNFAKVDLTTASFHKDTSAAVASVALFSGAYKVTDGFGVGARLGVDNVAVSGAATHTGFLNPQLSGTYAWHFGRWLRMSTGLTAALPVGSGGGNGGDPDMVTAHKQASLARSAMEGSMYNVNDLSLGYSLDFAYVGHGFTAQIGTTLWNAFRARGDLVQSDTFKANAVNAVGVGYFILPELSVGGEMRLQAYMSTPGAVAKDLSTRANATASAGVRGHFQIARGIFLRPGASYAHGVAGPVEKNGYEIVQFDVPIAF